MSLQVGGRLRRLGRLVTVAAFVVVCLGVEAASAQDWGLSSSVTQRIFYHSNVLLDPDAEIESFGTSTVPEIELNRSGPTSSLSLDGKFKFTEYFGHSELDSDGQKLNFKGEKELSERSSLNLNANFNRDTTLESEQDITSRFLAKPVRFITWDVAPSWTYLVSPISQISITPFYQSTDYYSPTKTDYQYYGGSFDYTRQISELAEVTGSLSYFRFDPDDLFGTRTDIYGGLVGYRYTPTERLSVGGAVGLDYNVTNRDTETGSGEGDNSDLGYRLKFNASYELNDQTKAQFSYSHDTEPSGDGRQVTRNRVTAAVSYQFAPKTTFKLDGSYSDNQDYFGFDTGSRKNEGTSRYVSVAPSVVWDITEDLSLSASYQFRHKMFRSQSGSVSDNAAFVTLRYALPDVHWGGL